MLPCPAWGHGSLANYRLAINVKDPDLLIKRKDFGHEQLPFKRFAPNETWYYMMLVGHFLLESFKEDVSVPVLSVGSYASTVRRRLLDIAGKIVFHSGETILKVSKNQGVRPTI